MKQPIHWHGDAVLSGCGQFRYRLRRWVRSIDDPYVLFVGLNPSTADAARDDNTVRAWRRLAWAWGYQSFWVGNVYAYRSTDPRGLWKAADREGPENTAHLIRMAAGAKMVVACWGAHAKPADYIPVSELLAVHGPVWCLGRNDNGTPKHPLFLPTDVKRELYAQQTKPAAHDEECSCVGGDDGTPCCQADQEVA